MGLWDGIKRQLRSVIEWENASEDTLFELWSDNGDEIKNASKLIVKPGQGAIFLYEGKIVAIHTEDGMFDMQTANIPFWTTLTKFMQAFESEHKVGVYFFWQTKFLNQKWGTTTPVKYDDPVYKFPVELRAHGNFSFNVQNPEFLFVNIIGARKELKVSEVRQVMVERFLEQLSDVLAESGFSYAEIDKNRVELSQLLSAQISPEFDKLGLEMSDFRIEGTTFDEATKTRIGRIADMTAEAEAARRAGLDYAQLQQLEALREAARNEGGMAGAGVGIGAGLGLGQALVGAVGTQQLTGQQQAAPQQSADPTAKLKKLKELLDAELISQEEYDKKKQDILASF